MRIFCYSESSYTVDCSRQGLYLSMTKDKQYGKRAKSDYSQLCVQIPKSLKQSLRIAVAEDDTDYSTYVQELIENDLKDRSKKKK